MSEVQPISLFRVIGFGIIALGIVFLVSVIALSAWEQRACDSGLEFRMDETGAFFSADGEVLDEAERLAVFETAARDGLNCATLTVHIDTDLSFVSDAQRTADQTGVRLRVEFERQAV